MSRTATPSLTFIGPSTPGVAEPDSGQRPHYFRFLQPGNQPLTLTYHSYDVCEENRTLFLNLPNAVPIETDLGIDTVSEGLAELVIQAHAQGKSDFILEPSRRRAHAGQIPSGETAGDTGEKPLPVMLMSGGEL